MGPDALSGRRILVLEDEGLILMTLEDILAGLGCVVAAAVTRPEAALSALERTGVDAALLDVNLGHGMTSYPVADALTARGVPFLFITGYGTGALAPAYRGRPILPKPVDERMLRVVLSGLLAPRPPRTGGRQGGAAGGAATEGDG